MSTLGDVPPFEAVGIIGAPIDPRAVSIDITVPTVRAGDLDSFDRLLEFMVVPEDERVDVMGRLRATTQDKWYQVATLWFAIFVSTDAASARAHGDLKQIEAAITSLVQ